MSSLDILMSAAGSAPSVSYWILTINSYYSRSVQGAMDVDSSGNARIVWNDDITNMPNAVTTLYAQANPAGTISFARLISAAGSTTNKNLTKQTIGADGSGYAFGATNGSTATAYLTKFNSSGVLQSQSTWNASGALPLSFIGNCKFGTDGNVYSGGIYNSYNSNIIKMNSSLTFVWGTQYGNAVSATRSVTSGVAVNNSTYDVYGVGYVNSSTAPTTRATITKVNSSGTIQWQKQLYGSATTAFYDAIVNSSGDVYACGYTGSAGILAKYNSSGTLQWVKQLDTGSLVYFYSVSLDSAGNVYVTGIANVTGWANYGTIIAKYNSSGTLQWQRYLTHSANGLFSNAATINAIKVTNAVYISTGSRVTATAYTYPVIAVLPQDGSLTGTYGNYTYSVATATDSTPSVTDTTWSPAGSSAFTNNVYTVSNTDAATTVTTTLNNM